MHLALVKYKVHLNNLDENHCEYEDMVVICLVQWKDNNHLTVHCLNVRHVHWESGKHNYLTRPPANVFYRSAQTIKHYKVRFSMGGPMGDNKRSYSTVK